MVQLTKILSAFSIDCKQHHSSYLTFGLIRGRNKYISIDENVLIVLLPERSIRKPTSKDHIFP